jgi:hypothetical protein
MIILTASTASYSDCWKPFASLFNLHWPDCSHERYIFSTPPADPEDIPTDFPFKPLQNDKGWCQNLLAELKEVQGRHEVAIVLQEDFFICDPVDNALLSELSEWLPGSGFQSLRLYPCPGSEGRIIREGIGVIDLHEPYRVSCQATAYCIPALITLLEKVIAHSEGTPKNFELTGADHDGDMFCLGWKRDARPWGLTYHSTAVVQNEWLRGALDLCKLHGIPVKPGRAIRSE